MDKDLLCDKVLITYILLERSQKYSLTPPTAFLKYVCLFVLFFFWWWGGGGGGGKCIWDTVIVELGMEISHIDS